MRIAAMSPQVIPQLKIIQQLTKKQKTKTYLVGGYWRDYLLGRPTLDFDFAVASGAIKMARVFAKKIKGAFVLLDEEHGCARVVKNLNKRQVVFDFANFRDKTIAGDLRHRDFTINTLCADIHQLTSSKDISGVLIDVNGARKDFDKKIVRMVSVNSFKEDPLRLLRAFSFQAGLGFALEKKTLAQIKKDSPLIRGVAYERICDEFFKILASQEAPQSLKLLDKIGLLEKIIPQVRVMFDVHQGGYHHLNVWEHSLETVVQLEGVLKEARQNPELLEYLNEPLAADRPRFALLKLAALLHDIGKPQTRKKEKGRTSFHGHERVGKDIVRHVAILLKISVKERHALQDMVLWHLRPGYLADFKSPSQRAIFRFFRDAKDEALSILLLSLADQRSTRGPLTTAYDQKHHEKILKGLIKLYLDKKKEKPFVRLISGDDLIKKLKLEPSPIFAKILREVEERQAAGEIKTKTQALTLAKKIAKK